MSTTTIRIDEALKARIATAAERAGKSSHAFILAAPCETVERVEMDDALHRLADKRWSKMVASGKSVNWDEAKSYLQARTVGLKPRRPLARKSSRRHCRWHESSWHRGGGSLRSLHRYLEDIEAVFILAIGAQRESGFKR